jgi:hypothetical protein
MPDYNFGPIFFWFPPLKQMQTLLRRLEMILQVTGIYMVTIFEVYLYYYTFNAGSAISKK